MKIFGAVYFRVCSSFSCRARNLQHKMQLPASCFLTFPFFKAYVCGHAFYNNSEASMKILNSTKASVGRDFRKGGSCSRKIYFPETTIAFSKCATHNFVLFNIFCLLKQLLKSYHRLPFQKETGEVRAAPECLVLQVLSLLYKKGAAHAPCILYTASENFLSGASRL